MSNTSYYKGPGLIVIGIILILAIQYPLRLNIDTYTQINETIIQIQSDISSENNKMTYNERDAYEKNRKIDNLVSRYEYNVYMRREIDENIIFLSLILMVSIGLIATGAMSVFDIYKRNRY